LHNPLHADDDEDEAEVKKRKKKDARGSLLDHNPIDAGVARKRDAIFVVFSVDSKDSFSEVTQYQLCLL
jgi:hypothetical protein